MLFAIRLVPKQILASNDHGDGIWLIKTKDFREDLIRGGLLASESQKLVTADIVVAPLDDSKSYDLANPQREEGAWLFQNTERPVIFSPLAVPAFFDTGVASGWLRYCKKNHSKLCGNKLSPIAVTGFRLIDCTSLSVVDAECGVPYTALSYVWGSPSNVVHKLRDEDGRLVLPAVLTSVISDAISVTQALGFQYLWVDKFCIDQGDPDAKHDQIKQMNAVYENAELTIVAAAGEDETYGLPGVGEQPRTPQHAARLERLRVLSKTKDAQSLIRSSRWSSRGWTFQEAVLSRRRLVFTDQQLYFECNAMNCFESVYFPLDKLHVKDQSKYREVIRAGMFGRGTKHNFGKLATENISPADVFRRYWSAIQDYTSRELSYDSDSLNAFRGIIERYTKLSMHYYAIWGLPYGKPVQDKYREYLFAASLSWRHTQNSSESSEQSNRRRRSFPSWTWAGWAGAVQVDDHHSHSHTPLESVRFGGRGVGWKDLNSLDMSTPESQCRVLRLKAKALPVGLLHQSAGSGTNTWRVGEWNAELFPSSDRMLGARLQRGLEDVEHWRCICISHGTFCIFAMVLERSQNDHIWTRVGMLRIHVKNNGMIKVMEDVDATWYEIG